MEGVPSGGLVVLVGVVGLLRRQWCGGVDIRDRECVPGLRVDGAGGWVQWVVCGCFIGLVD